MKAVFRINDKKAVVNTDTDICLYYAQRGLEPEHRNGTDIYLHITKNGIKIYYKYEWSLYQNIPDSIEYITEKEAISELEQRVPFMTEESIEKIKKYIPSFLEETS